MADDLMSDSDFGLQSDDQFMGGSQSAAPNTMSDKEFGLMSDDDFMGGSHGADNMERQQGVPGPSGARDTGPAPEGALASGVREFAHSVIPGAVGAALAPLGAAAGSVVPVAGTFAGGAAAFVGGSMAAEYAQEKLLEGTPLDDRAQRQANRQANPKSTFAGGLAGGMATMSPVSTAETVGKQILQRGFGGAAMAGFEAGGEALQGEDLDPSRIAMAGAAGAVFPGVNKLGEKVQRPAEKWLAKVQRPAEKWLAGRPGRTANPAADQAHADVGDDTIETAVGESALAESPPRPTGETVGAPVDNRPTNSRGEVATGKADPNYAKTPAPADNSQVTQGDMDPATAAALAEANPAPPLPPVQPQVNPNAQKPRISLRRPPPPSVEAGFPQAGEPVAMGANDVTPLPADMPARTQAAIARSKGEENKPLISSQNEENKPPPIKGTAAEPTEGQKEAGNYLKGRTNDFGKPIAIETHAGQTRRGTGPEGDWENTSPYHYGYFNKTRSTDKDHIDFARPDESDPAFGDKHFIIDQKNAETGKYDEPKVFTYVKDKDAAVDLYNRGFSDGKGPDRMHDITEVSRGDLVKYLARHTKSPPKGPYGAPMPKAAKPLAERAVVKDLIEKGKTTPEAIAALPPEQVEQAIEGKRTRKYGVGTGASAGYPVEGVFTSEGKPVTANTKAKAAERSAIHKKVVDWFEESKPPSQMDTSKETNGELLDRIKPVNDAWVQEGWKPTHRPKEWLWAREASKLLKKPTPGNIQKFRDAERLLRGAPEDVENYRGSNRVEADIARNKRSGDEAVAKAEAGNVDLGRNTEEDKLIDAIDAKRKAFDTPHEEAETMVKPTPVKSKADLKELPRKTVDAGDSELAKIDLKKVDASAAAKRRAEVDALVGKKAKEANVAAEDKKAGEGKPIKITDPEKLKALIELSNKAAKKRSVDETDLARENGRHDVREPTNETARLFDQFLSDERASLNLGKIKQDIKNLLKTTPVKSYYARPAHPVLEPHADYTRALSDELHTLDNKNTLHEQNVLNDFVHKLPKEADQATLARIFKAREHDSAHKDMPANGKTHIENLSPADKKVWDDHIKPMIDEADTFREYIKAIDPELAGPDVDHYIARITKGSTKEFDLLRKSDDPVVRRNALATHASMTNERPFVALENVATGERHVVMNRDSGFTWWKGGKAVRIKDPNYSFEANQPYSITNAKTGQKVDYIMRHATTDEIMGSGARFDLGKDKNGKKITMPAKYYQNAALSAALAHAKLGTMARNLIELARLSSTKEFADLTTRSYNEAKSKGWEQSKMPNMKGTYMAPELREVFDDYAGRGGDGFDDLRRINQAVTKLLFWMPTAHVMNVGAHWFVGRGFDNLNLKRGFETSMKAFNSVRKQDHIQKEMMENGAGLIYPSVATRNFIEQIAKGVGEKMSEDPKSGWRLAAQKAGVPFKALQDAIYNKFSSKVMWAANDMFLTQRYLELKAKGLSPKEAVARAERDIPNYRVPTRLAGGGTKARALSLIAQDNTLFAFSRYHVGMMNAYSDMAHGLLGKDASVGDRIEALGKVLALGALAAAYPLADKVAKSLTGNDDATQNRRGPMAIPYHLREAAEGREDLMSAARTTMTLQPFISTLIETVTNKDFRGKNVVEPGDLRAATHGDVKAAGRAGVQFGEHVARGLISPLSTVENTVKKQEGLGEGLRDATLDQKNPSAASRKWLRKQPINSYRDANTRAKHGGSGLIEGAYNKLTGR